MTRLLVHVEGETEETFVNELLRPHLCGRGYDHVSARLLGNARQRANRGGIRSWPTVRREIIRHLKGDRSCYATIMVDYYALPSTGNGAWPGRNQNDRRHFSVKCASVERSLAEDLLATSSADVADRFIPFVLMHEFEGLLFSDCARFAHGIGQSAMAGAFQTIRNSVSSPEEINDSPQSAPSKRVESLCPGYQKPLHGNLAAIEIGLRAIRRECSQFRSWIERLEELAR